MSIVWTICFSGVINAAPGLSVRPHVFELFSDPQRWVDSIYTDDHDMRCTDFREPTCRGPSVECENYTDPSNCESQHEGLGCVWTCAFER